MKETNWRLKKEKNKTRDNKTSKFLIMVPTFFLKI